MNNIIDKYKKKFKKLDQEKKDVTNITSLKYEIFNFLEPSKNTLTSLLYELVIFLLLLLAVIPFLFNFHIVDSPNYNEKLHMGFDLYALIITGFVIFDLILRWFTSDLLLKRGRLSYLYFLFSPSTVIILISVIPVLTDVHLAPFLALRFIPQLKIFSPTPGYKLISRGLIREKRTLQMLFSGLTLIWIIGAILIYASEGPHNELEDSQIIVFGDALWLIFVTITTIGFGDVTPVSEMGKAVTGVISIISLIAVALLTGVVLIGFTKEKDAISIRTNKKEKYKIRLLEMQEEYKKLTKVKEKNPNQIKRIKKLREEFRDIKMQMHILDEKANHQFDEEMQVQLHEDLEKIFINRHEKIVNIDEAKKKWNVYKEIKKEKFNNFSSKNRELDRNKNKKK